MLVIESRVDVAGLTGRGVTDFMLACTDERYRSWWPSIHLQLHTLGRAVGAVGDMVDMDELVGRRRLRREGYRCATRSPPDGPESAGCWTHCCASASRPGSGGSRCTRANRVPIDTGLPPPQFRTSFARRGSDIRRLSQVPRASERASQTRGRRGWVTRQWAVDARRDATRRLGGMFTLWPRRITRAR